MHQADMTHPPDLGYGVPAFGATAPVRRVDGGGILGNGIQSISTSNLQNYLQAKPGTGNTADQGIASAELAQRGVPAQEPVQAFDAGGGVAGIGGVAPSAQNANPMMRGLIQRYASLPTEKLQELSSMMGGSPQGQILNKLLSQRQIQSAGQQQATAPNAMPAASASMPMSAMQPPVAAAARGGSLPQVRAAGIAFMAPSGKVLFVKRSGDGDHGGTWAFPGGSIERGETPEQAARREFEEEAGHKIGGRLEPLHKAENGYITFGAKVDHEFTPKLNHEHTAFKWASPNEPPFPLHPGVEKLLGRLHRATRAHGGGIQRRAIGGNMSMSMMDPSWTRQDWRGAGDVSTGFLGGATLGRADAIRTQAPGGAYVLPADVVSGLGEGNSEAGARVWDQMLHTLPYGIQGSPQAHGTRSLPHPVAPMGQSKGGKVQPSGKSVPVLLSHGEIVVEPRDVIRVGKGDLKRGHRVLDRFVVAERAKHIKKLKSLPGPVKSK